MKKNTTLFVLILSCIFTIIILGVYLFNGILYNRFIKTTESFENNVSDVVVHSCPSFLKQFSDSNGDILCCKGDVNGHKCSGDIICAVSATSSIIPSCKIYRAKYLEEQGKKLCPKSMPNYYEHIQSGQKGCTYGSVNATAEAPASVTQKTCIVYDNNKDAMKDKNSCYLQAGLDNMFTPTTVTDKQIIQVGPSIYMASASYLDDMNMPRQCMNKKHVEKYYNNRIETAATNQDKVSLENEMKNALNRSIMICENAQKVFIDKTVSKSDAMF